MVRDVLYNVSDNRTYCRTPCAFEQIVRPILQLVAIFVPEGTVSVIISEDSASRDPLESTDGLAHESGIICLAKNEDRLMS
jgi:hypothetical protein